MASATARKSRRRRSCSHDGSGSWRASALLLMRVEEVEDLFDYFGLCPGVHVCAAHYRQPCRIDALRLGVINHRFAGVEDHDDVLVAVDDEHGYLLELLVRKARIFEGGGTRRDRCPTSRVLRCVRPDR